MNDEMEKMYKNTVENLTVDNLKKTAKKVTNTVTQEASNLTQ